MMLGTITSSKTEKKRKTVPDLSPEMTRIQQIQLRLQSARQSLQQEKQTNKQKGLIRVQC